MRPSEAALVIIIAAFNGATGESEPTHLELEPIRPDTAVGDRNAVLAPTAEIIETKSVWPCCVVARPSVLSSGWSMFVFPFLVRLDADVRLLVSRSVKTMKWQ